MTPQPPGRPGHSPTGSDSASARVELPFAARFPAARRYLYPTVLAALLILPGIGVREILSADEGQRAYPPLEMSETGDWIVPRINGATYLKKPPLLYWQVAGVYTVLGVDEWTARLPSALSGIAIALVVTLWARRFGEESTALLAGVLAAANYLVLAKSRQCQLDIPLALFTLAALWQWWWALRCLETGEPGFGRAVFFGSLWLSIAHLYKFPVPYIFLLSAWGGCIVAMRRWRWFLRWEWWAGLVGSMIPLAVWGIAAANAIGWDRAMQIWIREGALHVHAATPINSGPPWYYLVRLFAVFAPWCLLFPILFLKGFRHAQSGRRLTFHFLWTGSAVSVALLSINTAKETEYMLGAVPMMSILLAWAWDYWVREGRGRGWSAATRTWILGGGMACYFIAAWIGLPVWDSYMTRRRTVREVGLEAQRAVDAGRRVVAYDLGSRPQLFFYLDRRVPELDTTRSAVDFLRAHPDGRMIISQKKRKFVEEIQPVHILATSGPSSELDLIEAATTPTLSRTKTQSPSEE